MRAIKDDKILLDTAIKWELPVYFAFPRTAAAASLAQAPTGTPATPTAPYNAGTGVPGLRVFDYAAHQPKEPIKRSTDKGVIYYTFDTDKSASTNQPFSDPAREAARRAMTQLEQLTSLRVQEVYGPTSGSATQAIVLQFADLPPPTVGFATVGGNHVWLSSAYRQSLFAPGSVEVQSLVHNIGHTLGLNDAQVGDAGRFPEEPSNLGTVMGAYANYEHDPSTFMPYDVAELQRVYGVNGTYNSGDDVYNLFPSVATGPRALWDGHGVDTLSAKGYKGGDVTINLNEGPEYLSGDLTHFGYSPLVIDYGASIENAIGGARNDTITGNDLKNVLSGGAGNDTIDGGRGDDTLNGDAGADKLIGGDGNDILNGGAGADTLTGGAGADTLTGGAGADGFLFSAPTDGLDTITDFVSGTDRIGFDHSNFAGLSAGAPVRLAFNRSLPAHVAGFVFNAFRGATSGTLSWDPDGSGGAAGVKLATLTGVTTITANDLYVV